MLQPMSLPTQLSFLVGVHDPPAVSGCHSQDLSTGASYPSMPRLSWLVKLPYENLTQYVCMRPAANTLNYSVKDIRNDVQPTDNI